MTEKKLRGFAAMTPEQRAAIAGLGGRTAKAQGTSHRWTTDEARVAGAKSAESRRRRRLGAKKGGA